MGVTPDPAQSMLMLLTPKGCCLLTLGATCLKPTASPTLSSCRYCDAAPSGYRLTSKSKEPSFASSEMGVYGRTW
eukprot:scaffold113479_cov45-Phaeocystis_antarctica.AAC.1